MRDRHLIDTALFDIGFDDEETAFAAQSELEGFCKRRLLGVVEQVFEQASAAGLVMRLPRLEVDLGSVAYRDYRDELPRRLYERLSQLLSEWRRDPDPGRSSGAAVIERRRADYQLLEYFLLHGHLPWYAGPGDEVALDALLDRVLSGHAVRLRGFLQTTPHRHRVVARLAGQFSNAGMARLFRLLAPPHAAGIGSSMETMALAWGEDNRITLALGLARATALAQLWRVLIELVLEKDGRQENATELMSRALRVMLVERQGVDRDILAAFLEHADPTYAAELRALLQPLIASGSGMLNRPGDGALRHEDEATPGQGDVEADDTAAAADLRSRLLEAILSGDPAPIAAVWAELLGSHRALLERLLRRQGQRAEVRRRLAQGFSEAQLRDILEVLEPLEHAFVSRVIDEYATLDSAPSGRGAPRTGLRRMWEFSLGYLLVERGSRFNKKSYLGSLLRQMAAAENRTYRELLDDLLESLAAAGAGRSAGRQMRQLLLELQQEQADNLLGEEDAAIPEPRGSRLYGRLLQILETGREVAGGTRNELERLLDELQRAYPWQLLRLLRELQAGVLRGNALQRTLPAPSLRRLVLAFVDLTIPKGAELRDALLANARRASDPAGYFRQLLNCLVEQTPIDFELLLGKDAENGGAEAEPADARAQREAAADRTPLLELSETLFLQRLEGFLAGEVQLSPGVRRALIRGLHRRFARRPKELVRWLPRQAGPEPQARIARLVSLLSDDLLADFLAAWLGPVPMSLLHSAELITTAALGCPLRVPAARLRQLKWTYLLSALLESGSLLDAAGFIRGYVEHLARHAGHGSGDEFRAALGRQLLVDLLPSTRSRVQHIVQLLAEAPREPPGGRVAGADEYAAATDRQADEAESLEEIHVYAAGLVLAAPYLPGLFERSGLLDQGAFKDRPARERAVHLLQYLAQGEAAGPEYRMVIHKLLCGLPLSEPIACAIDLTAEERLLLDGLLQGLLDNWKALGKTSPQGLREAFLQREGRLEPRDDAWGLRVESKSYDMLLDQLPWGFSTIRYAWMDKPLYVEWR